LTLRGESDQDKAQEYFLPQGAGYPSYATALRVVPAQFLGYAAKNF